MRLSRRHSACLVLAALALVVAAGPWAAPLLIVAALLLTGRFVGEERILARRARIAPARSPRLPWPRRHELPLVSLLERAPRSPRGPPALVAV